MANQRIFPFVTGGLISSTSSDYRVQRLLGSGNFGAVAQCYKFATNETVALKIIKDKTHKKLAKVEEKTLRQMKELNPDNFNIVRLNDSFIYKEHYYLEFELLGLNLYQFMLIHQMMSLELKEIRPIMHQLATALQFLKSIEIVHADLKPENIMMVDHVRKPLKIKVSDFGLAHNNPEACTGKVIQSLYYRAPEVLLGAPYHEAIDVWSLGCISAELFMGMPLFPGLHDYDMMRHQVSTVGQPPDDLLDVGLYTAQFFHKRRTAQWQFMSPSETGVLTGSPRRVNNLKDLVKASKKRSHADARADSNDIVSYVNFLTKMLQPNASKRITPRQMLQHPFVAHCDPIQPSKKSEFPEAKPQE